MKKQMVRFKIAALMLAAAVIAACGNAESGDGGNEDSSAKTVALWLFDEPIGLYPSSTLDDSSDNDMPLSIGMGGQVVEGLYGHGLLFADREPLKIPEGEENFEKYGFTKMAPAAGRTVEPMTWFNAKFAALMTSGETHLRKEVGFVNPTSTDLNLGGFNWTIEFWHLSGDAELAADAEGVVFELGSGPRGENDQVTRLVWVVGESRFVFVNQASNLTLNIPSREKSRDWQHYAFTYDAADGQLRHYVDGELQPLPEKAGFKALTAGDEAYFSVGRDGLPTPCR